VHRTAVVERATVLSRFVTDSFPIAISRRYPTQWSRAVKTSFGLDERLHPMRGRFGGGEHRVGCPDIADVQAWVFE
jgi:hypothetical protein